MFSDAYLRSIFDNEYQKFKGSEIETALISRLQKWSNKAFQKETTAEIAFVNVFFEETWSYLQSGKVDSGQPHTCSPKFPISSAGQGGGTGEADAALGIFDDPVVPPTPQVICEFKDVRSNLDAPQKRKGNNRSPVKQCADYLREAMKPLFGNESVLPTWAIVTDMNEFRLYWRNTIPSQYQRFVIKKGTTDEGTALLDETEAGSFQRFIFVKLFSADSLLTTGGSSKLLKILKEQWYQEKEIESTFYKEYRAFREVLIARLIESNPTFGGTKGKLVRLAQKLIDRCIFVMFCEDMGEQLAFPPNALRDYLVELSKSSAFEEDEEDAWSKLKELFNAMNGGTKFRSRVLNKFNGGLFKQDLELEGLSIPNSVFCSKMQGENDDTLKTGGYSLLYFAGSYNFGTGKHHGKAITLFTLGRIFEQSITELEALEAQAEGKQSLTVISKRKRDGVFYTPEWVVERVVAETLGLRLDDIRRELGWSFALEGDEAAISDQVALSPSKRSHAFQSHVEAVKAFKTRLESFTVLDPACGSGAFLIHTLEYLLAERRRVDRELALVSGGQGTELFAFKTDEAVRSILSSNIFGVDINPASVEIARLALWLHTAKANQPLTNLDGNIVTGNSLVGKEVFDFKKDLLTANEEKKETLNAFDFDQVFPSIFDPKRPDGAGFDCVVGNPPYVKLQNFKKVYPETAEYLRNAKGKDGLPLYRSCQTGSYDLYLPFVEHGLGLLNQKGRLGYIAPSVWRYNEYGRGLRKFVKEHKALDRWVDFGGFQVFEEATIYTALQFYTRLGSDNIQIALAPDGALGNIPEWDDPLWRLDYKAVSEIDPWVFASQPTLKLLAKLKKTALRLGDKKVTEAVSQGLVSGAFPIFSNTRTSAGIYRSVVEKVETEIELEDAATLPLISASDIDRYVVHETDLRIIFPYEMVAGKLEFIAASTFDARYPLAMKHLRNFEDDLRKRDAGQFKAGTDKAAAGSQSHEWYAYSRNQNLEKQSRPKIVIAGTATKIEAAIDSDGALATNDKRVYSVFPADPADVRFLTGILNSKVVSFAFRQFARPKANGYYDIESQFLNPLPVPKAKADDKKTIEDFVDLLIAGHAKYAEIKADIDRRFRSCNSDVKSVDWLWPGQIPSLQELKGKAPSDVLPRARQKWAREERDRRVAVQIDILATRLLPNLPLEVRLQKGELKLLSNGVPLVDSVYVLDSEAALALATWRQFIRTHPISDARSLVNGLLDLRSTDNAALKAQLEKLDVEAEAVEAKIAGIESKLDALVYSMFGLDADEIKLIEKG